jgi:hypothetical protein
LPKRRGHKSHSASDKILSILLYLYNKPNGRSPTDIQLYCTDTKQDYNEIHEYLEELSVKGQLHRIPISEDRDFSGSPTQQVRREIFKITDDGRRTVDLLREKLFLFP